jgi:aminoglycoside phosphotransferase (APT) family kinase protein
MSKSEVRLNGGRTTPGVVRIGDTVRRPRTTNSDFVARLLHHLKVRSFEGVPSFLGIDERGRDSFAFIEGQVPAELTLHEDQTLRKAAALIRQFHDLSAELVSTPAARAVGIEVVCHNDLSPCNFVFRASIPVAIIDFDAAAPGTRLYDLGYAAWLWLDLGSPEIEPAEQMRRLSTFIKAYGIDDPSSVLKAAVKRQSILVAEAGRTSNIAMAQWATECMEWTQRHLLPQSRRD